MKLLAFISIFLFSSVFIQTEQSANAFGQSANLQNESICNQEFPAFDYVSEVSGVETEEDDENTHQQWHHSLIHEKLYFQLEQSSALKKIRRGPFFISPGWLNNTGGLSPPFFASDNYV